MNAMFRLIVSRRPFQASTVRRAATVALLLAVASVEPALAACPDGDPGWWWSLLGLPGFLNW